MKVVDYKLSGESKQKVEIVFDSLEIKYPNILEISRDPKFIEIARKYGLSSLELKHPGVVKDSTAELWTTKNNGQEFDEEIYSTNLFEKSIKMHREYAQVAEEVFLLITGQSLKLLWKAYCREKGILKS